MTIHNVFFYMGIPTGITSNNDKTITIEVVVEDDLVGTEAGGVVAPTQLIQHKSTQIRLPL